VTLEEPAGAPEPPARPRGLPAQRQREADPERAARGGRQRAGGGMRVLRALEQLDPLVLAAEHERGGRLQLEVRGAEGAGGLERGVRVGPRASRGGLTGAVELLGGVHRRHHRA
jgi:hypothetical protein